MLDQKLNERMKNFRSILVLTLESEFSPLLFRENHKLTLRKEKVFENVMQKRIGDGSYQITLDEINIPPHSLNFYMASVKLILKLG
jgi:hypothetical protein